MSDVGREIEDTDRGKILRTLTQWAATGSFYALRTRALLLLVWGSGLRLSEALAIDLEQILENPQAPNVGRIRGTLFVRAAQSKGRRKGSRTWHSAGVIIVTPPARAAVRAYLLEAVSRGWLTLPAPKGPLFVSARPGRTSSARKGLRARVDGWRENHERLGKRAAQQSWRDVQRMAQITAFYRFHDLRHDALTRLADAAKGNVFKVAQFGRLRDIRTAQRYVHGSIASLAELAELASRER